MLTPPFRAKNGSFYTSALFVEQWRGDAEAIRVIDPVFSFMGREGLIDARKTFVDLMDPTGYKWATMYLKSWEHWELLMKASWFREQYEDWLAEIKMILRMQALDKIREIAKGDAPQALAAARYLATSEWEKHTRSRGRPSKADLEGELKKQAALLADTDDDARRVGLTLVQGGKA